MSEAATFEDFFLAERDHLLRILTVITGSTAEAEDIAHEAFLKVWERWDRVRSSPADGIAYVTDNAGNLFAFDMSCRNGGEICEPIARFHVRDDVIFPPAVADGLVFAGTAGGRVLAFVAPGLGATGASTTR